ncbi:Hypothetical predicted protein [Paramuricea clavata]|uniref:Uncharacterized protein n=1 Tax=Paramuricea clavata TaxID=317549 RepID=A0A6S7GU58_PARCT|nr:Hypothetical predicted protein [Paramuricea clavata]
MAKVLDLPKLQPFTLGETSTISQRWRKWIKSFEYYIAASGINDKKQQRAILLHLAGPEVEDIFETLEDTGNDLDTAITKLTSYFEPQKNIPFERHNFRQTTQLQGETIEQLAIRLKHQVKFCEYGNPNDMIRDQIIEHCSSSRLRRRLLREPELTLEKTVEIGRSFEASERQASQIEADSLKTTDLGVNAIRSKAASTHYPTDLTRSSWCAKHIRRHHCFRNLTFFGHEVSASGVRPDTKKVEAIREARVPTNAAEVRSFLGLATYCSRFIPNFAAVANPLRLLTRKSTPWQWNSIHQNAFDTLKNLLTGNTVMAHHDPSAPTHLRVDASPVGLGAMLTQTQHGITKPIAYASRTLSNVERRYSQTEKEALAVVWGCEKFHLYLYGTEFTIYTDHKPLEIIYNPKRKPTGRIERWALRLQPYHFKIQ